jgi:hypothetical protein
MNRIFGLASALIVAASCTAAYAQQQVVPAVVPQGTVVAITPQGLMTLDPQIVTQPQAAPFNPAPLGSYIETTNDKRTVRYLNGYDVSYDINGRYVPTRAFITDGYSQNDIFPANAPNALWPLEIGKSTTFNVGSRAVTARTVRTEVIQTPAGQFFTYVIERRDRAADGPDNFAYYWYAPAVGTVVRFQERNARSGQRPSWEAVSIVLPQPLHGTVPVATPAGDSPENRAQYCSEHTTAVPLPNGQRMHVNCFTYTQALILDYTEWLKSRGLASARPN